MKLIKAIFFNSLFFLCLLAGGKIHASDLPISQSEFLSPDEAFVMSHEVVNDRHIKINWKIVYYLSVSWFDRNFQEIQSSSPNFENNIENRCSCCLVYSLLD